MQVATYWSLRVTSMIIGLLYYLIGQVVFNIISKNPQEAGHN